MVMVHFTEGRHYSRTSLRGSGVHIWSMAHFPYRDASMPKIIFITALCI